MQTAYFESRDQARDFCDFIERNIEDVRVQWHWDDHLKRYYVEVMKNYEAVIRKQ